jgi:hypothetical protein
MSFRPFALAIAVAAAVTLVACDSGRTYPDQKADDEYHLDEMRLTEADLPAGLTEADLPTHEFDNAAWVNLFGADDPEGNQKALDAQGRLRGYVATFQADKLGKVLGVTSFSTLYKDVASAKDAQAQHDCGVPLNDSVIPTAFDVPKLADGATGFFSPNYNADSTDPSQAAGGSLRDTNLCFRTGRILNVVQSESIPGAEDVAFAVRLADAMLQHVNDSFDGKSTPAPEATGTTEALPTLPGGSPQATASPAASATNATGTASAGSPTP